MANYQLSYTGAEIDSAVGKASKLPTQLGTAGQVLKVNSGGTGTEWGNGGTQLYRHTVVGGDSSITGNNTIVIINNSSTAITSQTLLNSIISSIELYMIDSYTADGNTYYEKMYFSRLQDYTSSIQLYVESSYDEGVLSFANITYDLQETVTDTVTAL